MSIYKNEEDYKIDPEVWDKCEKIYNIMENGVDNKYLPWHPSFYQSIEERKRAWHDLCFRNGISIRDMIYYINKREQTGLK